MSSSQLTNNTYEDKFEACRKGIDYWIRKNLSHQNAYDLKLSGLKVEISFKSKYKGFILVQIGKPKIILMID